MKIRARWIVTMAILVVMVCCSIGVAAYAEAVIQPRYTYLNRIEAGIWTENGEVGYVASVTGSTQCYRATLVATLQRWDATNSRWVSVESISDTAYNSADLGCIGSAPLIAGANYRVYAVCRVYGANQMLLEEASITKKLR